MKNIKQDTSNHGTGTDGTTITSHGKHGPSTEQPMTFENADTGETIDDRALFRKATDEGYTVESREKDDDGEIAEVVLTGDGTRERWTRRNPERDPTELWLEDNWEPRFFQLRFFLLVPVIVAFLGALIMFFLGSYNTYQALMTLVNRGVTGDKIILPLIKALDAFLLGIILVIFSFGVYDFFISPLEPLKHTDIRDDWLKFENIGDLKNKIIEVVFVVLAIVFFEEIVANIGEFEDPTLLLIVPTGAAIIAVSLGFFKWATEH